MTTSVIMPQLGETLVEGTLLRWLKRTGDAVTVDEPLLEISTDKVDTEIPSPATGVLTEIIVAEGETVPVGTLLATIDDGNEDAPPPAEGSLDAETPGETPVPGDDLTPPARIVSAGFGPSGGGARAHILSPLVRKLAAERGVDLATLQGTGTGGRITKQDVLAAAASSPTPGATPPDLRLVGSSAKGDREELVPLSHIRRAIGRHMTESARSAARAWTVVEVDMERVEEIRSSHKEGFREREGIALTYLPFVARATCEALIAHPEVNASLIGEDLLLRRYVDLGIAVAYDKGLIVPVIDDAQDLTIPALARSIADLAVRARDGSLRPEEVQHATFTITNPGSYGSLMSLPIINQPNTAILSLDAVERRPAVIDDAIVIRHRAYVSMSWDHRVIDGAIATTFLTRLKEHLETWDFAEDLG